MTIKEFTLQDMEDNAEDFSPEQIKAVKKFLNDPRNTNFTEQEYSDYEQVDMIYITVKY